MFILIRALTYAAFFIGFVLVALPAWVAGPAGLERPAVMGWPQVLGGIMLVIGAVVTASCVLTFVDDRPRHAGAVRSAATSCRPRTIRDGSQSDVHRRDPRAAWRRRVLPVAGDCRIRGRVLCRDASLRHCLRGADAAQYVRTGV